MGFASGESLESLCVLEPSILVSPYSSDDNRTEQVEWAEINAAWGQTLLLLYTIARKLDFTFEKCVALFLSWPPDAKNTATQLPTGAHGLVFAHRTHHG